VAYGTVTTGIVFIGARDVVHVRVAHDHAIDVVVVDAIGRRRGIQVVTAGGENS